MPNIDLTVLTGSDQLARLNNRVAILLSWAGIHKNSHFKNPLILRILLNHRKFTKNKKEINKMTTLICMSSISKACSLSHFTVLLKMVKLG